MGANLFIGNLEPDVDEKLLYDTFSAFGGISQTPKIMRDVETGVSKGYGFVSFDSFEASDLAIDCMNGQYLCNRPIVVQYAFKKETQGERHGSQAERLLAASQPQRFKPHTIFSGGDGDTNTGMSLPSLQLMQPPLPMQFTQMGMPPLMGMPMPMMPPPPPNFMMPPPPMPMGGFVQPPNMSTFMMPPPPPPVPGGGISMPPPPPIPGMMMGFDPSQYGVPMLPPS